MGVPELIIHIGSPKTGTSSLQNAFTDNLQLLHNEGIYYPLSLNYTTKGMELSQSLQKEVHAQITNDKQRLEIQQKITNQIINNIRVEFSKNNLTKILLSSEDLFSINFFVDKVFMRMGVDAISLDNIRSNFPICYCEMMARFKQLFSGFNIKIVCYLRRQDLLIESLYNQSCKGKGIERMIPINKKYEDIFIENCGNYSFPENYLDKNFISLYKACFEDLYYYEKLNTLSNIFGKENIIVKAFEKSQFKEGLVKDFFINVLGISPNKLTNLIERHDNERISRDVLEYINYKKPTTLKFTSRDLVEISNKIGGTNMYQSYFTLEERLKLIKYHNEGNQKVAIEYLNKEDGLLFNDEVDISEPKHYPGLTPEKIVLLDKEFENLRYKNKKSIKRIIEWIHHKYDTYKYFSSALYLKNSSNLHIKKIKIYGITVILLINTIFVKIFSKIYMRLLKRKVYD